MAAVAIIIFAIGLILIASEQKTGINKSAIAIVLAGSLWILVALVSPQKIESFLLATGDDIFEIIIFLACAMTLVEILAHYRFFDVIRAWLVRKQLGDHARLWVLSFFAFLCSAVIDNLTTTIIFTQLIMLLYRGRNLVISAALVVIAANAGGAFSPIGDITTTMLWLQGKFSSGQIFAYTFLPSLAMYIVAASILIYKVKAWEDLHPEVKPIRLSRSDKTVVLVALGSFTLPFIFNEFGLRPYLGLLAGLGITWIVIDILKARSQKDSSHFSASIEDFLKRTDVSVLLFFTGILLAVAALDFLGILRSASSLLFGNTPKFNQLVTSSVVLGFLSAIVDNVPLTAAAMQIVKSSDPYIWALIALAVGTGGSLLVIGSAAGVIAMSIVKDLTFSRYLKEAGLAALLSYFAGIAVWYAQHQILIRF